ENEGQLDIPCARKRHKPGVVGVGRRREREKRGKQPQPRAAHAVNHSAFVVYGARMLRLFAALLLLQGATGWSADNPKPECSSRAAGFLSIDPCAGWIRTLRTYDDFQLTFSVHRAGSTDATGVLAIGGVNESGDRPGSAIAIPLLRVDVPELRPPGGLQLTR